MLVHVWSAPALGLSTRGRGRRETGLLGPFSSHGAPGRSDALRRLLLVEARHARSRDRLRCTRPPDGFRVSALVPRHVVALSERELLRVRGEVWECFVFDVQPKEIFLKGQAADILSARLCGSSEVQPELHAWRCEHLRDDESFERDKGLSYGPRPIAKGIPHGPHPFHNATARLTHNLNVKLA
jgi:hypothetical protein